MNVNIILVLDKGLVSEQYVIVDEITAEAQFNSLAESLTGDSLADLDLGIDYGQALTELNIILQPKGIEVIWVSQVKLNKFKNGSN